MDSLCDAAIKLRGQAPYSPPSSSCVSYSRATASNPAPHLVDIRPLNLMVTRVSRCLVEDVRWSPAQLHPLSLKPKIAEAGNVLIAVTKVVWEEQRHPLHLAKPGSLERELLDL